MMNSDTASDGNGRQSKQLATLVRLLSIEVTGVQPALSEANTFIADAIGAAKVEVMLYDPAIDSLVATGASQTPMSQRQIQLGLDRLQLVNGGRVVEVFQTGRIYQHGHVDQDEGELIGLRQGLGIRSAIVVPVVVGDTKRGVFQANWTEPEAFDQEDAEFVRAVAGWIVLLLQRAELVERLRREAAEESRRMVAEELVTVLAHDLGNYLTPLIGHTYILHARAEQAGRADDLRTTTQLRRGLERLKRLIDDLLDISRIEQGIFGLVRQPVEVCALVHAVANALSTPDVTIQVEAPTELIAEADPERIRQALENLVSNAVKHSPKGMPVTLSVASETRTDDEWAVLTVQDRGPGIASNLLPQLMERFVKDPKSKGLGLGLYLARSIAEAHGGTLTVESTVGMGTTFRLALPLSDGLD